MREKANYRETLSFLINEKQCPLTFTKKAAAETLGISRGQLDIIIAKGRLKLQDGRIPVGSIASYLCG